MKKSKISKALFAALVTSAVFGGGTLISHADSLDIEPNTGSKNSVKEETNNNVAKIEEIKNETEEKAQPVNTAETTKDKVEEEVQPVNNTTTIEEDSVTNNEEKVEEKVEEQNNENESKVNSKTENTSASNREILTENKDKSLELSEEKEIEEVKAAKERSTRGIEELNKLDNKNLNKDRLQFLEKLASAIDNVPYKGDAYELSNDSEYKKYYAKENPDSLTCSEFMSWGLYQTGHKEVENHYVRDFYADTKNFTHLSDKDILTPGDFILDYRPGNRTGHILVYAGKDANGVEYLMQSTRDKGSNPNETTLQNGPNIIKRSDYKIVNSYPIFVRYNGFEKVEKLPTDTDNNNYASETNKNTIGNFQVDDIKITRADDPSKESYFESPYNFNISFSNIGKIKEGDSLKLIGYYPKLYNTETKEEYYFGVFPYTSKDYNETVRQDIKIKYNNKDIVIGQLVGNKITFNKNVESLDKFNFSVSLGIATKNRLNVEKEGRKDLYEVPFYVNINGKALSKPYLQKIKPNTRKNLVLESSNYVRGRIYHLPTEKNKQVMYLYDSPFNALAKLRDENHWKDGKIRVKITLPEGLEFNSNQNIEKQILTYYSNEKKIVLAANHDINRHYDRQQGILSSLTTIKDNKTAINSFDITDKPLADGEGDYDRTIVGALVSIMNSNAVDLKTGKLKNPIKFEYFVNDKLVDTKELTDIEMMVTSSSSEGGSVDQSSTTTKKEIKAKIFYETDDKLDFGKQVVVKKPVNGEKEITITKKIVNGKVVEEKSEKIIKQKQDGLTRVGNKKVETTEIPSLPGGSKPGIKTTTTIYDVDKNTGKLINPKTTVKTVYPAEKIQDKAKTTKVTKENIPFNTIYKKDDKLKYNEKKVIQKGVKGENKVTTITQTGKESKSTKELVKKPIDEIIAVGNKKVVTEEIPPIKGGTKPGAKTTTIIYDVDKNTGKLINPKETVKIVYPAEKIQDTAKTITHEEIPFKTVYVAKADLKAGEKEVFQKGVKGKKEITQIGSNKSTEKVIEKPTTEIIGIGNRKIDIEEVPPIKGGTKPGTKTTTTIWDIDSKTGKLINPKVTTKISYPAEKIGDVATTVKISKEEVPFKTIYKADENLTYNSKKVIQKGENGENKVTTTKKPGTPDKIDKELVKKPIDEIISIGNKKVVDEEVPPIKGGTKPGTKTTTTIWDIDSKTGKLINPKVTTKISYPMEDIQDIATKTTKDIGDIDFEIIYEADPTLEYGATKIKQDGKKGKKEITTISKIVDGKRVEEKSDKIIEKAINKIISVGNKKLLKNDIDYKVIEKETNELEVGKSKIEKPGEKGIKETITTSEVDPKTGKLINEKTDEVITKKPIDEIKLIGTKKVVPWTDIKDIAKRTSFPAAKIHDIAKPIDKEEVKEQSKEDGNGKAKEELKEQPVKQTMVPIAQSNVQTGVENVNPAIITVLLSSVGLAITNKKKKED